MSTNVASIDQLLGVLQADGRSSPKDWHRFHLFLKARKRAGQKDPPVPLILAASGESDASKYRRLTEQMQWAQEVGCLDGALQYLRDIPADEWNSCPLEQWNQESYPS